MFAGDLGDIGARNAEVVQLTVVESGELTDGLLISGPLLESLTNAHLGSPSVWSRDLPVPSTEIGRMGESEQWSIGHEAGAENA